MREYVEHYHHERNHQGLDNVSHCRSSYQARERSDATSASAAYGATIGGRPHSAADRVFGQDGMWRREVLREGAAAAHLIAETVVMRATNSGGGALSSLESRARWAEQRRVKQP